MTEQPHPGLVLSTEERLRLMAEALDRGDEPEPEPEPGATQGVSEESGPSVIDDSFDAAAYAAQAWERAGRIVRPEERAGDLVVQMLAGGAAGQEALHQLGSQARRAGWHYSVEPRRGTRTPLR
ncbi:hypothetical protein ACFCZ3_14740 [Cellulosimicrobium cellulans]|uniref:hypothetical protein n=1 Tax=Cellulosimicrobium cellulans TaxID=1710 RepID=UPI0035D8DDF4